MYEKIAGSLITLLVPMLIKWIVDGFSKDRVRVKKRRVDELSDYLSLPIEEMNRLAVQENFQYFFKYPYTYEEIVCSLKSSNPLQFLELIKKFSTYIEVSAGGGEVDFKEKYSTVGRRKKVGIFFNTIYFIFAFLALMPIIRFEYFLNKYGSGGIPFVALFSVFMMFVAILCLNEAAKPEMAAKLKERLLQKPAREGE
ncbi:hypothetical protein Y5S_00491 [Alcanivorax nanhaiticus]|uniref:Uncharacterized protein n=1 Tax=Alcanivorax nanhaiticus TaxID=1177154 RepID=A0A095SNV1_9GAMM|nr:hypothetical protein [Alcanivorax nanhaiticus]KGD66019.1 hypothetical protein Y5S_00491 [Alcanivorax nanhaiticus]